MNSVKRSGGVAAAAATSTSAVPHAAASVNSPLMKLPFRRRNQVTNITK
jgi:hypothetical protein